jgi:uncharacterized membrane protein
MNSTGAPEAAEAAPLDHTGLAAKRVMVAAIAGFITAGIALAYDASWSVAALIASDIAALVYISVVWWKINSADSSETKAIALAEDNSRRAADAVLLVAGAASLVAVGFTLRQAGHAGSPGRGLLTALALASVALAWASVHTVFLLRYARLYYGEPMGGIDFHDEAPDYQDFAYLALTIGMTFQVSDTGIAGKRIRHTALRHALLSYVYGTGILAVTVSSVAALLGR